MGEYCEEADYKIKLYTVLSAHRPNEVHHGGPRCSAKLGNS